MKSKEGELTTSMRNSFVDASTNSEQDVSLSEVCMRESTKIGYKTQFLGSRLIYVGKNSHELFSTSKTTRKIRVKHPWRQE